MPKTEKHFETSVQRTGKPYTEVHQWIDDPAWQAVIIGAALFISWSAM